jgi:hypothetical protein
MTKKLLRQLQWKNDLQNVETLASSDAAVAKHLGKAVYTVDEVKTIDTQDQDLLKSKATMLQMLGVWITSCWT